LAKRGNTKFGLLSLLRLFAVLFFVLVSWQWLLI